MVTILEIAQVSLTMETIHLIIGFQGTGLYLKLK